MKLVLYIFNEDNLISISPFYQIASLKYLNLMLVLIFIQISALAKLMKITSLKASIIDSMTTELPELSPIMINLHYIVPLMKSID